MAREEIVSNASEQLILVDENDREIGFKEVVRLAYQASKMPEGLDPGLEEVVFYDPAAATCSTGMHLAVVLVDADTGRVTLRDYTVVDDCGFVINPMIVEGQIHGGLVQGIGQALMEHLVLGHRKTVARRQGQHKLSRIKSLHPRILQSATWSDRYTGFRRWPLKTEASLVFARENPKLHPIAATQHF